MKVGVWKKFNAFSICTENTQLWANTTVYRQKYESAFVFFVISKSINKTFVTNNSSKNENRGEDKHDNEEQVQFVLWHKSGSLTQ